MESRLDDLLQRADELSHAIGTGGSERAMSHQRLSEREEDEMLRSSLVREGGIPRLTVQPPNIRNGTLKDYQLEGLNWMIQLFETNINGILADEMGLGKTIETIALVAYLDLFRTKGGHYLIVVPMSTLLNWIKEFHKWCPSLRTVKFHGDKHVRRDLIKNTLKTGEFSVVITSYEIVLREAGALRKIDWSLLVVDEAHRLKNENSKLFQTLNILNTKMRLLLTGTPLQNNLHELWALLNFLLPDIFQSSEDFDALFAVSETKDQSRVLSKLHKILTPFLLRRLKADVAKSLPPKKEIILYVGMSALQKRVYKQALLKNLEVVQGTTTQMMSLQNVAMQLRKASNHPYLFEGVEDRSLPAYGEHMIYNCGKMLLLDKLLRKLLAKGSRVLIFSQMTRVLDILEDYCEFRELPFCRIDGMTPSSEREEQIVAFNEANSPIPLFLLTTRSGGLGINLYTADIVILYDSDWNPQMDLQAQDRAYRIGQTKPVFVYRLVTQNTIDEKIVERAELKLRLDALVIQQGRLSSSEGGKLSKDTMLSMIRFGAEEVFRPGDTEEITDEHIDSILSQGEEKSKLLQKRVEEKAQDALSLLKQQSTTSTSVDLLDESFADESASNLSFLHKMVENLGERRRKRTRNPNPLYDGPEESSSTSMSARNGLPVMYDFQFFRRKRIRELHEKQDMYPGLSQSEELEKAQLLKAGFSEWSRVDYLRLIRQIERFGRHNKAEISKGVPGKSADQVLRYYDVFWERLDELKDKERILALVEKTDRRLAREQSIQQMLSETVGKHPDRLGRLKFRYAQAHQHKGFLAEHDQFLVWNAHVLGYGQWNSLYERVREMYLGRFDYFMLSRTAKELQRRTDILVRLLEKKEFMYKPF